jgi:hypothetical protein
MIVKDETIYGRIINDIKFSDSVVEIHRVDGSIDVIALPSHNPNYLETDTDSINYVQGRFNTHLSSAIPIADINDKDIVVLDNKAVYVYFNGEYVKVKEAETDNFKIRVKKWNKKLNYNKRNVVLFNNVYYKAIKASKGVSPTLDIHTWRKCSLYNMFFVECENIEDAFTGYIDVSTDSYISDSITLDTTDKITSFFNNVSNASNYAMATVANDTIQLTTKDSSQTYVAFSSNSINYFGSKFSAKIAPDMAIDRKGGVFIIGYTVDIDNPAHILFKVGIEDVRPEHKLYNKVTKIKSSASETTFNIKDTNVTNNIEELSDVEIYVDMAQCSGIQNIAIVFEYTNDYLLSSHMMYNMRIDKY